MASYLSPGLSMEIVDAQLHEIGPQWPWEGSTEFRYQMMAEVTLGWMDAAGVDAALLNPHDRKWGEFATKHYPARFKTVWLTGYPSPENGEEMVADVLAIQGRQDVLGLRIVAGRRLDDPEGKTGRTHLANGLFEPLFAASEQRNVPIFIFASGNLDLVARLLDGHPDLRVVIDSNQPGGLYTPEWASTALEGEERSNLLALARYPVSIKVCGLPAVSKTAYPYPDTWPYLRDLITAFGSDRIIWASDVTRYSNRTGWRALSQGTGQASVVRSHLYADSFRFIRDSSQLGEMEKTQILGENLRRFLDWKRE
jgi:hypothetical protein